MLLDLWCVGFSKCFSGIMGAMLGLLDLEGEYLLLICCVILCSETIIRCYMLTIG